MKKIFFALIVLLFFFGCINSQETKEPIFVPVFLELNESITLTGTNQFEGQQLILRFDDFFSPENFYEEEQVKFSLFQGNQLIDSKYFIEFAIINDSFPLLEKIIVSEININEARNRHYVMLHLFFFE